MDSSNYLLIAGLGTMALFVIVLFAKQKGKLGTTDYRAIFVLGVIFLPIGFVYDFPVLQILGMVYILMGIINKDKWGKRHTESADHSYTY